VKTAAEDTAAAATAGRARHHDAMVRHGAPRRYATLLDGLHAAMAPGQFVASPSGYILASPQALGLTAAGTGPLRRLGLACVTAAGAGVAVNCTQATADWFADGLHALHCTVVRRALARTVDHLGPRTSEGTSLLARSLIQAELAGVAIEIEECQAAPEAACSPDQRARWACDQRLTDAGRVLLRLLGAISMLLDGPAADLYLAEVAGNVYLQPERGHRDG
jgi:hypothetical protein